MPIRTNGTPAPQTGTLTGRSAGTDADLDRQLDRARQALSRGDLPPTDAAKLRSLLTLAGRALSRGDVALARQYADDAEKASGTAEAPTVPEGGPGKPEARDGNDPPPADEPPTPSRDERRVYQDVSSDPGVSFQQPTELTAGQAEVMVRFHERQHLRRDTQKAEAEGRKVVYAYTAISYGTDPATGKRYIKGGKTVVQTTLDPTQKVDTKA